MSKRRRDNDIEPLLDPEKAIELLNEQIAKIDELQKLRHDDSQVYQWNNFTEELVAQAFGRTHNNYKSFRIAGFPQTLVPRRVSDEEKQGNFIAELEKKNNLLQGFVQQLQAFSIAGAKKEQTTIPQHISKKVFIVHGHDFKAKDELTSILSTLRFEPIILDRQPNEGKTLIEKLEKHSDVGYAFIILTPDDIGRKKDDETESPRARQNVVFEYGLFVGKLGRNRICCLRKGDIELPSDLQGVAYIQFNSSVNEIQLAIVRELRAAGYEVEI